MSSALQNFETRVFRVFRREPPSGIVHRGAFWLFLSYLLFCTVGLLPGETGILFQILRWFTLVPLLCFASILFFRWVFGQLLWKLRNRLIVTYLLMGLAPLVLFAVLTLLVAYLFSGQFATLAATSALHNELVRLGGEDREFALHVAHALAARSKIGPIDLPDFEQQTRVNGQDHLQLSASENGRRLELTQGRGAQAIEGLPTWVKSGFQGIVLDRSRLFLRAVESETVDGRTATVVASLPLKKETLNRLASGVGSIHILSNHFQAYKGNGNPGGNPTNASSSPPGTRSQLNTENPDAEDLETISGGILPSAQNFLDVPVEFFAPLNTVDWRTGKPQSVMLAVTSRPGLLYHQLFNQQLFTTSLQTGTVVQRILIGVAILFCALELIAFLMAVRLNQTITASIHDLYLATTEIDKGNFLHRIGVKRRDQLAALSSSFNSMAASLARLLLEQREKQRLENELTIAQEVQANLFPHAKLSLKTLELHGACRPARTVSGDYYDFLILSETQLLLAMGDISGKGISAALLMASLHSAVRAYRFAGEELEDARMPSGSRRYGTQLLESGRSTLFETPGKMLELLNRHLYRSTQPEKYATLFLAYYDSESSRLTYSNGGQIPPLVLCADGTIQRLDCGGTVVGLIDDVRYEEASVRLQPGDLLVAYSDGVTEPENEFGEFGEERLVDVVRRSRRLPLATISDQVLQALRAWIGEQEQPDDITLVLARQR
ncbi:MAG TPA: SpoIIE family protein phosphatase [Acidobacteriaceae bacterium]